MTKTTLNDIELTGNLVLVKPDPNFDFIPIKTPTGEVKIHLAYNPQDETKHVSISGTVLKTPKELKYYGEELFKSEGMGQDERSSYMRNSTQYKTTLNIKENDRIFFNYHNQFQADDEGRLINVEEHGICMLMHYETLYGKEIDGEFVPLNGYVVFTRDQQESQYETVSGLTIIKEVNIYASQFGFVVAADTGVTGYLDKSVEENIPLTKGDKIMIDPKFGYRIAYSLHAGEMRDYEIIRRKHIIATFD